MALMLIGCAAPKYKTTYQTRENGVDRYYDPKQTIDSIRSVNLSPSGILTLDGYRTSFLIEYEGPKMEEITTVRRPADPGGALVNTAVTLGLNLLLAPKHTGSQAIGDTSSEYVSRTYIDKSRSKATGRTKWETKSETFNGSVLIYGVTDQPLDIYVKNNYLDISNYLRANKLQSPLNITIVCKYCTDLKIEQNSNYAVYTRQKTITYDTTMLKQERFTNTKAVKEEPQRTIKSTNSANVQKCIDLGLREGSENYNKCVKTLSK
jgi:hypothetical protein